MFRFILIPAGALAIMCIALANRLVCALSSVSNRGETFLVFMSVAASALAIQALVTRVVRSRLGPPQTRKKFYFCASIVSITFIIVSWFLLLPCYG